MERNDGADPLPPIPGNDVAIESECRRLTGLAEFLDDLALLIRRAQPENWASRASDSFEERRDALAKSCHEAADAHFAAAGQLASYLTTLKDVLLLRRSAVEDVRANPTPDMFENSRASIMRWKGQLASAARQAAHEIGKASDSLARLRRQPAGQEQVTETAERMAPDISDLRRPRPPVSLPTPAAALQDPASYRRRVQQVNDAVFDALLHR
jgi:hypothetical protein